MPTYTGKCHCGAVEWKVESEKEQEHILCHCNTCKVLSGSEYTLNLVIPKKDFQITRGKDHLGMYTYKGDSGNETHCHYCKTCTAHPYHDQTVNPHAFVVRSSLLTQGKDFKAAMEIYDKDRWSFQPKVANDDKVFKQTQ